MTTQYAKASVTISPDLIGHAEKLYSLAMEEMTRKGLTKTEGAHRTSLAIPAYVLSVAAVEAFLNEVFLSRLGRLVLGESILSAAAESVEKLDLPAKLLLMPHVAFGRSLDPGKQPYQDMVLLTQIRNELVHYKMGEKPPKAVMVLAQRGIAFRVPPEQEEGGPHPWAERVSTLEGIRWAHNTACATAVALLDLIPDEKRGQLDFLRHNFQQIP